MCRYTTLWNISVRKLNQFEAGIVIDENLQGIVVKIRCDEIF